MRTRRRVASESDLSRVIVDAARVAMTAGLGPLAANRLATAVSELGRNILKYAGSGEITLQDLTSRGRTGVEAIAVDRGPGIADVDEALRDHFSTSGTLGLGLPGVKRMMDQFEIESAAGHGTKVTVRLFGASPAVPATEARPGRRRVSARLTGRGRGGVLRHDHSTEPDHVTCAWFNRPCLGERVSGDAVFLDQRGDVVFLALVDALGHGDAAHRAAVLAYEHLRESWSDDLVATIRALGQHLRGSVGAAAGLATFDVVTHRLRYVAIGNVILRPMGSRAVAMPYTEGTLGGPMRNPREQELRMEPGQVALMYSDGVSERLREEDYPQLRYEQLQTVARTVVERFGKAHDDATCIALRCPP